jgi:RNA recognition motif-containing protein
MGTRLYVGNLPFHATSDVLRTVFAAAGEVTDVHVMIDRETGRSRGFGFVTMGTPEEAARAISQLNGQLLEGRALRVNEAEERAPRSGGFGGGRPGGGGGGGDFRGGGGGRSGGGRPKNNNRWLFARPCLVRSAAVASVALSVKRPGAPDEARARGRCGRGGRLGRASGGPRCPRRLGR